MQPLDVGLDIDGVLYPFSSVIAAYATEALGFDCTEPPSSYDWYRTWGLDTEGFVQLCARAVRDGVLFTDGDPLPGSVEAAAALRQMGHRIHFVTARELPGVSANEAAAITREWLTLHDFPDGSLTVTATKAAVATHVFLDDSPATYDALVAASHPCPVLWHHPSNASHPARRVQTWAEFLAVVRDRAMG